MRMRPGFGTNRPWGGRVPTIASRSLDRTPAEGDDTIDDPTPKQPGRRHHRLPRRIAGVAAACALPLLAAAVLAVATTTVLRLPAVPPEHLPFARLDLERPIGLATGFQLSALRGDPLLCQGVLALSALETRPVASRRTGAFCGFLNAVEVQRSAVPYSGPVRVTCAMAAALYLWEREVVAPAALRHLGSAVVRIDHLGSYSCRRIGGGPTGRPSQHATANAIDVAGFRLADGRRVTLLAGWAGKPDEQAFLRALRDGACDLFRGVLGPDHNAAHRDHFHLDMGPFGVCR